MIKSLLYIRVGTEMPATYSVPLLESFRQAIPGITTYEFDNFSEESIRHYGLELVKQSGKVAVVVEMQEATAPPGGVSTFLNRLMKAKPESLLMVLQGEQPLFQKMMQAIAGKHFHQNLSEAGLKALLQKFFS